MRTSLLLAFALLTAGCATAPPPAEDAKIPDGPMEADSPAEAPWAFTSCTQFHTSFAARAQDFSVPPGFVVEADAAGLVALRVTPTVCAEGNTMVVSVPVDPPQDQVLEGHAHEFVVELYADNQTTSWLRTNGLEARECACALDAGAPLAPVFRASAAGHEYTMRLAMVPRDGAFSVGAIALFAGDPPVRIVSAGGNATNLGVGGVVLEYSGPGGAPPAFPGYLAHGVHGLDTAWEVR